MKTPSIRLLSVAVLSIAALGACSRIPRDLWAFKYSSGTISDQVAEPGMHLAVLDSYYPIDTMLTRAEVKNMQPKDSHGVSLRDVSVVVTYGLDPARVAAFYRATKEMDPEPNSDYTLGLEILQRSIIPYAVQIATERSDLSTISSHLGNYAQDILNAVQQRLDKLYPGINPFVIQSVTVSTFDLPPTTIQAQVNAKAGYQAELQTIAAEQAVIEQRKELVKDQATVNADALAAAAQSSGLKPDQIIEWERARAQMMLAQKVHDAGVLVSTK